MTNLPPDDDEEWSAVGVDEFHAIQEINTKASTTSDKFVSTDAEGTPPAQPSHAATIPFDTRL